LRKIRNGGEKHQENKNNGGRKIADRLKYL